MLLMLKLFCLSFFFLIFCYSFSFNSYEYTYMGYYRETRSVVQLLDIESDIWHASNNVPRRIWWWSWAEFYRRSLCSWTKTFVLVCQFKVSIMGDFFYTLDMQSVESIYVEWLVEILMEICDNKLMFWLNRIIENWQVQYYSVELNSAAQH